MNPISKYSVNLEAELHRIWFLDRLARDFCPIEKVFTERVPDKFTNKDGEEKAVDVPYMCIFTPDVAADGGTSQTIKEITLVQVSCFAGTRADAKAMRDFARGLFEDCDIQLAGDVTFEDISLEAGGILPAVDGVFEAFQRFNVETAFTRPRRKKVL